MKYVYVVTLTNCTDYLKKSWAFSCPPTPRLVCDESEKFKQFADIDWNKWVPLRSATELSSFDLSSTVTCSIERFELCC